MVQVLETRQSASIWHTVQRELQSPDTGCKPNATQGGDSKGTVWVTGGAELGKMTLAEGHGKQQ